MDQNIERNNKITLKKSLTAITIAGTICVLIVVAFKMYYHRWPSPFHFLNPNPGPVQEVPLVKELPDQNINVSGPPSLTQTPEIKPTSINTTISNAVASPVSASTTLNYKVGVALGNTLFTLSQTDLTKELNDISSMGIGWIRIDMAWDDVQYSNSTTYDWTAFDRIVNIANSDHLRILADLGYTPKWARSSSCSANNDTCPPANNTQFATFAAAAVKRYTSKGITTWEVWNEPNIGRFWEPSANVTAYTNLLKTTYRAIKQQNASATVVSAGLAPALTQGNNISPADFLTGMYKNGAKSYFDAVGMHPYSFPAPPSLYETWSGWSQMSQTPVNLRGIMTSNGDSSKQIWMTEYGAPTGGPGYVAWIGDLDLNANVDHVTDNLQTKSLTEAITIDQQSNWAGPIFIYSYKDVGIASNTVENFFGLLWYDNTGKPSYNAVKNLLVKP